MTISIKHQKNTGLLPDWTQSDLDDVIAGNPPPLPPSGTTLSQILLSSDFTADHVIDTTGASNGDVLTVVSGQAEWAAPPSGGTPAGSTGQIQFNNAGAFGADSGLVWDNTNKRVGLHTTAPVSALSMGSAAALNSGGGGLTMYSTVDEITNFQRLRVNLTSGNIAIYDLQRGGTGAIGFHSWRIAGTAIMEIDSAQAIFYGHLYHGADNTRDIGRLSASPLRFRSMYLGTSMQAGAPANTAIAGSIHGYAFTAATIASVFQGAASQTANLTEWRNSAAGILCSISAAGKQSFDTTITAAGTTGAQTINKPSGTVNFAAGATSLVVTNNTCTTSSIVLCVIRTNDATAVIKNVVPAAGSFTINLNAAATAETSVGFIVYN